MGARKSCLETERNKRRRQFQNFRITSSYNFMSRKRAIETAVIRRTNTCSMQEPCDSGSCLDV